jgi:hypothetical protein
MAQPAPSSKRPAARGAVTVLLTVAVIGTLWVPIYARSAPKLGSLPFFYWYQLIWVPVAALLCWTCYLLLKARPASYAGPRHGGGERR